MIVAPGNPGMQNESTKRYLLLSFCLPFVVFIAALALRGVYPFGSDNILTNDFYHQYYPFTRELQRKLQEGSSLFWSWNAGLGTNFLSLYAYYLSSPFSFLISLFPSRFMPEALLFFIAVRMGLAGLTCAAVLKQLFQTNDLSLVIFSAMYALCGFNVAYFWCYIWLDSVVLLPLIVLGTMRLLREKRYALYTISLALSIWCNFLIGIYICVFVALVFFFFAILDRPSPKEFFIRLGRIVLFSTLAICMSAVLLLPAFLSIQTGARTGASFPDGIQWLTSFSGFLGNFAALYTPAVLQGDPPNVYSGILACMLLGSFLFVPGVSRKGKVLTLSMVIFLGLSLISTQLYFIWNAFNQTANLPGRFAFLLTFVLVFAGFSTFRNLGNQQKDSHSLAFIGMVCAGSFIVLCASSGELSQLFIWINFALVCLYALLIFFFQQKPAKRKLILSSLLLIVTVELCATAYNSLTFIRPGLRKDYPPLSHEAEVLLAQTSPDEVVTSQFSRTDILFPDDSFANASMAYGYPSASLYTSVVNGNAVKFLKSVGLQTGGFFLIKYDYLDTSPILNAFLDVGHIVAGKSNLARRSIYLDATQEENDMVLYQNTHPLSLGFMTHPGLLSFVGNPEDPFTSQDALFSLATGLGLDTPVFGPALMPDATSSENMTFLEDESGEYTYTINYMGDPASLWLSFTMPEEGMYYIQANSENEASYMQIMPPNTEFPINSPASGMLSLGYLDQGDSVSVYTHLDADNKIENGLVTVRLHRLEEDVFESGYAMLADEQMSITAFSDTEVNATIHAENDGLLYTSIPYEKGWRAFVDGIEVEITPLANAMLCVPLSAGEHHLRFTYVPEGFWLGLVISVAAILVFVGICIFSWQRKKRIPPAMASLPPDVMISDDNTDEKT